MLTGGMKESQMERIQIRDEVPFEAFVATLQFIYTDSIDVDVNLALDVLPLASEYNLQRLKVRSTMTLANKKLTLVTPSKNAKASSKNKSIYYQ